MTPHELYMKALDEFNAACESYRIVCSDIRDGKEKEFKANSGLNDIISMGWRLRDAALLRDPAPMPPRRKK